MENDQGRFRAVVMGVVLISIASMPPLLVIQTKGTGKERKHDLEEIRKLQNKEKYAQFLY